MKQILWCGLVAGIGAWAAAADYRFPLAGETNFGSGSVVQSTYFEGGIPNTGVMVGHANLLNRKDRALVRFDISDLYLTDRLPEIKQAFLTVTLWYVAGAQEEQELRVEHLDYETGRLAADDLSRGEATEVGRAAVVLKEHPPKGEDGRYRFDVTDAVKADLAELRQFSGFRITNAVEELGNGTGGAFGFLLQVPGVGHGAIPVLEITTGEEK